jgi:hypothetical protein
MGLAVVVGEVHAHTRALERRDGADPFVHLN